MKVDKSSKYYIAMVFLAFCHGSSFYLGLSFVKPSFIVGPVVILVALFFYYNIKPFPFSIKVIVFCFIIYSFAFVTTGYNSVQYLDQYYFMGLLPVVVAAYLACLNEKNITFTYYISSLMIISLFLLMLFEIITGIRFVPKTFEIFVSATFNNSNDLATIFVVFYPLLWFMSQRLDLSKQMQVFIFLVIFCGLILTMSRTALALFLIINVCIFASKNVTRFFLSILLCVLLVLFLSFYLEALLLVLKDSAIQLVAENAQRLWLFLFALEDDKSVGARADIYQYFFDNFDLFHLGYGIKNYSDFFIGSNVIELAKVNPHSLLIDLSLSFGFMGLIFYFFPCFVAFYLAIRCVHSNYQCAVLLILSIITYFATSFIPSSIWRIPLFFFPLYCAIFISKSKV